MQRSRYVVLAAALATQFGGCGSGDLSHDNRSMSSGVTLVQKVAKLTRQYLGY